MLDASPIPVLVHAPPEETFETIGLANGANSWEGLANNPEEVVKAIINLAETGEALGGTAVIGARLTLVSHGGHVTALAYGDAIRWK